MTKKQIEAQLAEVNKSISETKKILKKHTKKAKELEQKLAEINKQERGHEIIEAIDAIFAYVEDANTVILGSCYGERADCFTGGRNDDDFVNPEIHIRKDYNSWCDTGDIDPSDHRYVNLLRHFIDVVDSIDRNMLYEAEDLFCGDDAINEYWSGYIGLTKDYKIVSFICRDDNYMLNEAKVGPHVLYDFNYMNK